MADPDFSQMSDEQLQQFIASANPPSAPAQAAAPQIDFSKMDEKQLADFIREGKRAALRAEGVANVESSMKAAPEYIEVPVLGPDGSATGQTEKILKPSKADPTGRGAMSMLPFGEDVGAFSRSLSSGRSMSEEKDVMQGEKEAAKAAYPKPFMLGQAAAMVPQAYLPMGLAARGTTALGRTGLGALEGAGYAGLTGFGEGNTLQERLEAAKHGLVTGSILGGILGRFAGPAEKAAEPVIPEVVQAADRLGVELPRYAVTESKPLQQATKISESLPLAGEPVIAAREKAVQGLEDAVDALVPKMTTEQSGNKISQSIGSWLNKGFKKDADAAYNEVRSLFENPEATKTLDNTADVVADIMTRRAKAKLPGTPPVVDTVLPAIQSAEGITFDGAKTLYSAVRNLRNENRIKGIEDADVERLYKALRADVLDTAEAAGGEPARYFLQQADRDYAMMQNTREKLQKIVGKKEGSVSDEQTFNRLLNAAKTGGSADNRLLARAINVMDPPALQAFQAGILAKMGRDAEGKFSPDRWLGNQGISGLSDRAKAMIFKDQPELLQALNDVTTVSKSFKNLNKYGNPSGTGRTLGGLGVGSGLLAEPISTISGLVGANVFTRIMSKPQTAKSMADWSRRYENYVRRPTQATGQAAYESGLMLNRVLSSESDKPIDVNAAIKLNP
jgi:hypothetical protein